MDLSDFKNNLNFYKEKSILDINHIVNWKKSNKKYNFETIPKTAILSLSSLLLNKKQRFFSKKTKGLYGKNYILNKNCLYCSEFGNGAPAIIGLMEELKALGVENFIFIGLAGLLDNQIKSKIFYVSNTYSTSGTTYFYSDKDNFTPIKNDWFDYFIHQLNYPETSCWSTDVPYRETKSLVSYFLEKNVQHVDMECASIYAFSQFYNLNALCILVSADEIVNYQWEKPSNILEINKTLKEVLNKIIFILNGK